VQEEEPAAVKNDDNDVEGEEEDYQNEEEEGQDIMQPEENEVDEAELFDNMKCAIDKVRKICRLFRKSPVKNDLLQKYLQDGNNKELGLILDTKTRWNSLLAMVKRFLELKQVIPKVLIDLSKFELFPNAYELALLQTTVSALDIVECGVNALNRRDMNLSGADKVFEFMLAKLEEEDTTISRRLYAALEDRINERRLVDISGLLRYLESQSLPENSRVPFPTRNDLAMSARDIYTKLFWKRPTQDGKNDDAATTS
jgi:hypothetical protein